jgi:hypothetical protein
MGTSGEMTLTFPGKRPTKPKCSEKRRWASSRGSDMEGWLYGLFTLLGVLAGGLFTYLGMKKQLEQQRELDSCQWRRKVRSEPLLKLRDELANMASKLKMLVIDTRGQHYRPNITGEEKNKELERAVEDLKVHLENGGFLQALNLQYDAELLHLVDNIISSYSLLFEYALNYESLRLDLLKEFHKLSQEIETKIPEVQELINKRLEEL